MAVIADFRSTFAADHEGHPIAEAAVVIPESSTRPAGPESIPQTSGGAMCRSDRC
ncbi:hypothetical protein [Brevibacterium sp. UCMA 11754]|uniref:hypothetical protein n=1 Tax=Brevibacterium sp. UCMA 11754 TaxID=2749198 RepID=UPI001F23523B|nr:hypothetical protein [Brevibacterium sp. UCMA 11754]MCF2572024.1 hypothetical protein [Brevibacterium sp. UCMA 11754]